MAKVAIIPLLGLWIHDSTTTSDTDPTGVCGGNAGCPFSRAEWPQGGPGAEDFKPSSCVRATGSRGYVVGYKGFCRNMS